MHRLLSRVRRLERDERGAVAIVMALTIALLMVGASFALDFGLVRVDREVDQSVADSAVLAGLHALNQGDGSAHSYVGVCTAVQYLMVNNDRLSGLNTSTGWTNGLGASTGNGCSDTSLRNRICTTTDLSSWAVWSWSGTSDGVTYSITVQSGYSLGTLSTSTWPEDSLAASSGDTSKAGCDQLAVTINQSRRPTFGSIATTSALSTRIRSVGRVKLVPGKAAPAMLLLKRTGCPALQTGNSGGGSGTFIHVLGAVSSSGVAEPGTIHADTDGTGCSGGSNNNIFIGAQTDGIVAYAAPLVSNPSSPDPSKPGVITTVAAANGITGTVLRDSVNYVHGSSALSSGGTASDVTGRGQVTRSLIDDRYFTGVKGALSAAASVFSSAPTGWTVLSNCNPTQASINSYNQSTNLMFSCANFGNNISSALTIKAGNVFFTGTVTPKSPISMPNAAHVYVQNSAGSGDAITIPNNSTFGVNNGSSNLNGTTCAEGQSTSKAELFVKTGDIKQTSTGSLLQMCRTTVFMMGGQSDGCVPTTSGTAPTSTPCSGSIGTGQITQNGGGIDWTAPDTLDAVYDSTGAPTAAATAAWQNTDGPEDLALWAESGTSSSTNYSMAGGGVFHVRGVFMVPNADSLVLSGGSGMNLTNAQFIVSSIQLNGGAQITMSVDPNSAVTLPDLGIAGLVR